MGKRNKKGDAVHGWINVDKPIGITSTQVIGKIRRFLNAQKVGHAGTLDPLASGVLPIALGEATKTIPYMQDAMKSYQFTVTFGEQRSTDDAEGEILAKSDNRPTQQRIEAALPTFMGDITQVPPKYSAIKIDGQRAYDLARQGEVVEIKEREVYIERLELLFCDKDTARFEVVCGKGTYVRSIARDLALSLGTYGYVSALRRTSVGAFHAEDAILLDNLEKMDHIAAREAALLPLQVVLDDIPALEIKANEVTKLRNGNALPLISKADFQRLEALGDIDEALAIFQGQAVALVHIEGPQVQPFRVFNF